MPLGSIHIHQVIVHKVDRRVEDGLELSDLESPVTDPRVLDFLRQRIAESTEHIYTRKATFLDDPNLRPSFQAMCDALLAAPSHFAQESREIATHLYNCMDARTSPGDLLILTYSQGEPASPRSLALLKMDPEDGLQRERKTDAQGNSYTLLTPIPDLLPSGELQKCAFILHPDLRQPAGHDLTVLDQQIGRGRARKPISTFFSRNFLQCRLAHDPAYLTTKFYDHSYDWIDDQDDWPPLERQLAKQRAADALNLNQVDVAAIAQELTADPVKQDQYVDYLRGREVDLVFQPDEKRRERLLEYTYYEGDNDLKVKIRTSAIGKNRTLHAQEDPDTGWTTVVITTRRWDERPK